MPIAGSLLLGLVGAVCLGKILLRPLQWLGRVLLQTAVGMGILLLFNFLMMMLGWMTIPVHMGTVLVMGFFGFPGLVILLVFRMLLSA